MAYIQKNTPPPNQIDYYAISDFSGGLNNIDAYMELNNNESINLLNVDIFREHGVVWQRGGTEYKDVIDLTDKITLLDEHIKDTPTLIRASDDEIYNDGVKVADLDARAQGTSFQQKYFFVDGNSIRTIGTFPQTGDTYTTIIGTPNPSEIVMELRGEEAGYTPLDATHDIGVTVYDYNNNYIYYNPCENELNDEFKGANFLANQSTCIEQKEGRLYISGDVTLPYSILPSDIQNPYYFPVSLGLQITPKGNPITKLIEFHDAIVIFTKESIHAIYGNTNRTDLNNSIFYLKDINVHTGTNSPATVKRVVNYLYFLGNDGVVYSMYTPNTDTNQLLSKIISDKITIFEEPLLRTTDMFADACAVYYDEYYYLSLGDLILVYSFLKQAWTVYDSINASSFKVVDYELLIGNTSGRVVKFSNTIYNDLDEPIVCFWKSKRFSMSYPSRVKKFKDMYVIAHTFDTIDSEIKVTVEIDYEDVENISTIKNKISRWGEAEFGDKFISRNINQSLPIVLNRRGRLISFIFANDELDQTMRIYEINGQYELRGFR